MKNVALLLAASLIASIAQAQVINPVNTRPIFVNGTGGNGEPTLASILNGPPALFTGYTFNVNTDQSTAGVWSSASSVATSVPTLIVEYAGFSSINKFGIWFGTDASQLFTLDLLLGNASAGDFSAISISNGVLQAIGFNCGVDTNCGTWNDTRISPNNFGFFFQTGNGPRVFSVDALNTNNEGRFLSFQAGTTSNWAFAYEDIAFTNGSDRDYNDMIVKVESIVAVPEPTTVALMLAGLGLLGFVGRRVRSV